MSSKQKVILVTGASAGIGHASAMALAKAGHIVYGAARRVQLMDDIVAAGGNAIEMDVTDDASVQAGVDEIIEKHQRIDGLFANAGYCLLGAVETAPSSEVLKQFDTNVVGVGRAVAAVLPHMRSQKSGTILITSSIAGHIGMPGMAWYPASKFALQGLGDGLRMELKPFGINVSLIEPGYIASNIDEASWYTLDIAAEQAAADVYASHRDVLRKKWGDGVKKGASPDSIASVVVQAFNSNKPKRRYRPNPDAKMAYSMKRLFGDSLLDRMLPGTLIK